MELKELTRSRFPRNRLRRIAGRPGSLGIVQTFYAGLILSCLWACDAQLQQQQYFLERPQNTSVREGQTATLRCKIGNQHGKSQWTKDGLALGYERNIPGYPRYSMIGDPALGEHHLRIDNVTLQDDFEYQCQVGPLGEHKLIRADARLTVLVPPVSVEIVEHAPGSRIEIRENEEYVLQCVVRNAKPAADIVWYKRNVELKSANREDGITDGDRAKCFDTKSKITIRAQADDNDADYSCEARHPALAVPKRTSVSFSVLYPPGPPEIVGYTEEERVLMGQEVTLSCVSRGGNPLPQLVWYKNDVKVDFSYNSSGRESRNTYRFVADATDNNAKFRCEATNSLSPVPLKAEITLTVHFPPASVTVKARPEKLRPGQVTTLTCESSSSYPASKLSWWRNGVMIPGQSNSTSPGQHGGTISRSTLQLQAAPELDRASFTCQATNDFRDVVVRDSVALEVLYKPEFVQGSIYTVEVEEGKPAVINMTARGNPANVTYLWSRAGKSIGTGWDSSLAADRITARGPLLNVTTVRREDSGDFKCDATNTEGTNSALARLNVLYGASIVKVRSHVMVSEGMEAFLECQATGNPLTAQTVKWRRAGFDMESRTQQTTDVGVAYLTVQRVTRDDFGAFECVAYNGIAEEVVEKTWLFVKYKPVMDVSPEHQKAAAEVDQMGKLVCRATGAPNITFNWTREGVALSPSAKYEMQMEQIDLITWQGTMYVRNVATSDYGPYDCIARNEMGFNKSTVMFAAISGPDTPLALQVLNVSHEGVQLSWRPAFDGGLPQAYKIRYMQAGSDSYKIVDVYPPDATVFTVNGLALGTEYLFSVASYNTYGASNYTTHKVVAKTSSPWEDASLLPSAVSEAMDTPKIVIIAVSTAGSILLLVNIVLVTCYLLRKRKKKCMEEATSSEGGSSKSATIEMYAPSSYNETVNGETLSSISEKSESYSHNGSHSDYAHDDASKPAVSTYLIDQSDSQPPYGSYRVNANHGQGTLNRTPKTVNFDMGDDNYIDTLRRNAYSHVNEPAYGKSRSHASIAANPDSYYTTSPLGDQSRYVAFPPAPPSFSNGPLRYNSLSDSANSATTTANSPYTPMGSLNIPAAAAAAAQHHSSNGYNTAGRQPSSLPMNLPLPLPLSMQNHGHYPHYPDGPASLEVAGQFTGPTLAPLRSLETEGHLV